MISPTFRARNDLSQAQAKSPAALHSSPVKLGQNDYQNTAGFYFVNPDALVDHNLGALTRSEKSEKEMLFVGEIFPDLTITVRPSKPLDWCERWHQALTTRIVLHRNWSPTQKSPTLFSPTFVQSAC
jgi:hypothetical protein